MQNKQSNTIFNRSGSPSNFVINVYELTDVHKERGLQIRIDQKTTFQDLTKKIKQELNLINQSNCSNQSKQTNQTNQSNQSSSNNYDLAIYLQNEQYQGEMNDYLKKKIEETQCQLVQYKKVQLFQTSLKRASNSTHHHGDINKPIVNYYYQKQKEYQLSKTTSENQQISQCCLNYSRLLEAEHKKEIEKYKMHLQQVETEKINLQKELNQIQNQNMKNSQTPKSNIKSQNSQINNKSQSYSQLQQEVIDQKFHYENIIQNMKKEKDELLQELNKMNLRNQLGNQEQQYAIQELNSKLQNKTNNLNNSVQQKQESVVTYQYSKIQNQQLDQSIIKITLSCNHAYEIIKLSDIITQAIIQNTDPKCKFCSKIFTSADLRKIGPLGEQYILLKADNNIINLFERWSSKILFAICQTNNCQFFCIYKQNLNLKTQNNFFYCPLCLKNTVALQPQRK